MTRLAGLLSLLTMAAWLSACGEEPQTLGARKSDVAPYQGAPSQFAAPGWNPGDKASWERGLKVRMQHTQNEYTKTQTASPP